MFKKLFGRGKDSSAQNSRDEKVDFSKIPSRRIVVPGADPDSPEVKQMADFLESEHLTIEAREDMRAGRYREALPKWLRASQLTPKVRGIHFFLGQCYCFNERYDEALASFQKEALLHPEAKNLPEYVDAVESTKREARWKKEGILSHMKRGTALMEKQAFDQALESYRSAIKINPKSEDALLNLGVLLAHTGKTGEARKTLEGLLRLNPNHQAAKRVMARI